MEPLINLNLQYSQLKEDEKYKLIQTIIKSLGNDQIMTVFFNHFLHSYLENEKVHHADVSNITEMICKIINSRKKKKESDTAKSTKQTPKMIKMNDLPSQMIRNCASFLEQRDYLEFSTANRTIYCAVNSPCALTEIDIHNWDLEAYKEVNFRRFTLLEYLHVSTKSLNSLCHYEYSENDSNIPKFVQLKELSLFYDPTDGTVSDDYFVQFIPCDQISKLTLVEFGQPSNLFDFQSFIDILSKFINVSELYLSRIHLTPPKSFKPLWPKLQTFNSSALGPNISANILRDELMRVYSKQLSAICFDEEHRAINTHCFNDLEKLSIFRGSASSVKNILDNGPKIKHLELWELTKSNTDPLIESIDTKLSDLEYLLLSGNEDGIGEALKCLEIGLFGLKLSNKKSMRIEVDFEEEICVQKIILYVTRILNALDASNIESYILMLRLETNAEHKMCLELGTIKLLKETHLVINDEVDAGEKHRIIISNKNCTMAGSQTRLAADW